MLVPQYTVNNHTTARMLARDPHGRQGRIPVPSRVVDAPLLRGRDERPSDLASSSDPVPLKRPRSPSPVVRHSRIHLGDDDSVAHASTMGVGPPMDVPEPRAFDAATAPIVNEDAVRSPSPQIASGALDTPNSPPSNVFRLRSLSYVTPPPASPYDPRDADDERCGRTTVPNLTYVLHALDSDMLVSLMIICILQVRNKGPRTKGR